MGLCSYPEDLSPLAVQRGARTQLGSTVACLGGSVSLVAKSPCTWLAIPRGALAARVEGPGLDLPSSNTPDFFWEWLGGLPRLVVDIPSSTTRCWAWRLSAQTGLVCALASYSVAERASGLPDYKEVLLPIPCTHGIHVSQGTVCCALDTGLMGLSSLRRGVPMGHSFPHPCKAPHVSWHVGVAKEAGLMAPTSCGSL